ncbi:DUF3800 domain-containing protein [Clostridium perfringens]|uniref:DUF3800 domain-containing protein n=1 Tax=Clostridium perfringens TaxID=1502 RepID=UPI00163DCF77|nr:DUF3800 domain-containing protein [Clostridium perfringens]EHA6442216.1 DUF3800 domain-containing protein [Clostridium perfringens]EJT5923911.1 DUF3800 domain-containing protein [Clostridium perfringens]
MSFNIYFDESNKIDEPNIYKSSYYGALSCSEIVANNINELTINEKIELHFSKFKLKDLNAYTMLINKLIENEFYFNTFIVDSNEIFTVCKNINISNDDIRPLLYIKIPERLVYGITRNITTANTVKIFIDQNSEYTKYKLEEKLKEQLNAQAIYRKLNYSITNVQSIDSKSDKLVQLTDVLLGIVAFITEKKYLNPNEHLPNEHYEFICSNLKGDDLSFFKSCYGDKKNDKNRCLIEGVNDPRYLRLYEIFKKNNIEFLSGATIAKSELIFILLQCPNFLKKLSELSLFIWEGENINTNLINYSTISYSREIKRDSFSKYLTEFMQKKIAFDWKYKNKILKLLNSESKILSEKEYRKILKLPGTAERIIRRYLSELDIDLVKQVEDIN